MLTIIIVATCNKVGNVPQNGILVDLRGNALTAASHTRLQNEVTRNCAFVSPDGTVNMSNMNPHLHEQISRDWEDYKNMSHVLTAETGTESSMIDKSQERLAIEDKHSKL